MRLLYKACFRTGTKRKIELKDIAPVVREWAAKKAGTIPEFAQELARTKPNASVNGVFIDRESGPCFAFELLHPDAADSSLKWRTTIACARNDRGTFNTEVALYNGREDGTARPASALTSRPYIVHLLISEFGAEYGFDLSCKPISFSKEMTSDVVKQIYDPLRKLPLLVISARNDNDRPVLSTHEIEKIASLLAGTALVYVATNRFTAFRLEEQVGKSMACYNGAMRLYWPIPAEGVRSFPPFWRADEVMRLDKRLSRQLLLRVSSFTAGFESEVSYDCLMAYRAEAKRNELLRSPELKTLMGAHAELQQLLDLYVEDNDVLKKRVLALTAGIEAHERELMQASSRIEELTHALDARKAVPKEHLEGPQILVFRNVLEAVEQITESYSENTLAITPKAMKGAEDSNYEEPADVYRALEWLATTYLADGKKDLTTLRASCLQVCRMTYHASQGHAMEVHPEDYHVNYEGKKYDLAEHLCKGTSRDGRRTIRIGFAYDDEKKRVIVGYISQHQTTAAT
jgi:hypothetical protein